MYTYDDTPGDKELKNFTIDHDLKDRIPFIKRARSSRQGQTAALRLALEPARLDENQRRDAPRRQAQARIRPDLGRLLS